MTGFNVAFRMRCDLPVAAKIDNYISLVLEKAETLREQRHIVILEVETT